MRPGSALNREVAVAILVLVSAAFAHGRNASADPPAPPEGMKLVEAGVYTPFYPIEGGGDIAVEPFYLDELSVTNGEFLEFVRAAPQWRKSRASALFTDEAYGAMLDTGWFQQGYLYSGLYTLIMIVFGGVAFNRWKSYVPKSLPFFVLRAGRELLIAS